MPVTRNEAHWLHLVLRRLAYFTGNLILKHLTVVGPGGLLPGLHHNPDLDAANDKMKHQSIRHAKDLLCKGSHSALTAALCTV